jgi:general stress protein YciG
MAAQSALSPSVASVVCRAQHERMAMQKARKKETSQKSAPSQPVATPAVQEPRKSRRGFAAMDPEKQREIASSGGKAAHAM